MKKVANKVAKDLLSIFNRSYIVSVIIPQITADPTLMSGALSNLGVRFTLEEYIEFVYLLEDAVRAKPEISTKFAKWVIDNFSTPESEKLYCPVISELRRLMSNYSGCILEVRLKEEKICFYADRDEYMTVNSNRRYPRYEEKDPDFTSRYELMRIKEFHGDFKMCDVLRFIRDAYYADIERAQGKRDVVYKINIGLRKVFTNLFNICDMLQKRRKYY